MAEDKANAAEDRRRPMSWTQLAGEIMQTVEASMGNPLPPEFWEHMRTSRKERLLAMRSLLDARIAHEEELEARAKEHTLTKIPVQ